MTSQERQQYLEIYTKQLERFEAKYTAIILAAIKSQIAQFVHALRSHGVTEAIKEIDRTIIIHYLPNIIKNLYIEAGLFFGRKKYREIRRSARFVAAEIQSTETRSTETRSTITKAAGFGLNERWVQDIINYLTRENFRLVQNITETTKRFILRVLTEGVQQGLSIDEMAARLESDELSMWRARLIARTELVKAAFEGGQLAERDSDWETQGEWIAAHDHRTRLSHKEVDGKMVDTGKRFKVTRYSGNKFNGYDMMLGPGDPTASPENICHCRCALATAAKRDSNGRLIPKKSKMSVSVLFPGEFITGSEITLI